MRQMIASLSSFGKTLSNGAWFMAAAFLCLPVAWQIVFFYHTKQTMVRMTERVHILKAEQGKSACQRAINEECFKIFEQADPVSSQKYLQTLQLQKIEESKNHFFVERIWHPQSPLEMTTDGLKKLLSALEHKKGGKPSQLSSILITSFVLEKKFLEDLRRYCFTVQMQLIERHSPIKEEKNEKM